MALGDVFRLSAAVADCPFSILMPEHYRFGSKCGCYDAGHRQETMLQPVRKGGWGYTAATFRKAGIEVSEGEVPGARRRQFKAYPMICAGCAFQWDGRRRGVCPTCGSSLILPRR